MTEAPILEHPNFSEDFILDTDASKNATGAVLSQNIDGKEKVIAYASRTLSKSERRYCVTRNELLAVVHFVKHFRHFLYGRKFTVRTDHSSLQWLVNFKNAEDQLARWLEILSSYNMKILHRPGAKHSNADALSRIPCKQCGFTTDWNKDIIVNALTTVQSYDGKESTEICKERQKTLQQLQAEDDDIQVVVAWIKAGKRPEQDTIGQCSYVVKTLWLNWQDLQLKDDLLYRTCKQGN